MRGKLLIPALSLALLGFAVFHVTSANQEPPPVGPPVEPARSPYAATLAGTGVVEPKSENVAIGSPLPGVAVEVLVAVGDRVYGPRGSEKGTPLFRLDDRALRADRAFKQAALKSAESSLSRLAALPRPEEVPPVQARVDAARASLGEARDQFKRAQRLYSQQTIGEQELVVLRQAEIGGVARLAQAEAELALLNKGAWGPDRAIAAAAVERARAELEQTETELERLIVRSPLDGTVLQRNVRCGEYVGAPPSQALLVLGDISTLHVRADIDENDLPRFKPGLTGHAVPRGAAGVRLPLKFVRVEPYVVPKRSLSGASGERVDVRVLQVILAIDGPAPAGVYVGQQVDVLLDLGG